MKHSLPNSSQNSNLFVSRMTSACFICSHNKFAWSLSLSLERKEILTLVSRATKLQGLCRTNRVKPRQDSPEVIEPKTRCLNFPTPARTRMINATWLCTRCNYCWWVDHYLVTLLCLWGMLSSFRVSFCFIGTLIRKRFVYGYKPANKTLSVPWWEMTHWFLRQ